MCSVMMSVRSGAASPIDGGSGFSRFDDGPSAASSAQATTRDFIVTPPSDRPPAETQIRTAPKPSSIALSLNVSGSASSLSVTVMVPSLPDHLKCAGRHHHLHLRAGRHGDGKPAVGSVGREEHHQGSDLVDHHLAGKSVTTVRGVGWMASNLVSDLV